MKRSFVRFLSLLLSVSLLMHSVAATAQPELMGENSDSNSVSYQIEVVESEQAHDCCENTVCYCNDVCEQGSPCSVPTVFLSTSVFPLTQSVPAKSKIVATKFSYQFNNIEIPKRPPRI